MTKYESQKNEPSYLSFPAAIYITPSRRNYYGFYLDDHISEMWDYAQENNIVIVKQYIIKSQSSEMINFLHMVEDFKKDEFALLLLHNMDEIARDYLECLFYQALLQDYSIPVTCVEESPAPFNIQTDTLANIINAYNKFYTSLDLHQRMGI